MGTMSIRNWIIQNIGYKKIGLYKKKCILKILQNRVFCLRTAFFSRFCGRRRIVFFFKTLAKKKKQKKKHNYRSGIILCVFACRYLYVYIFLEYVLNEIYIIMSQSNV